MRRATGFLFVVFLSFLYAVPPAIAQAPYKDWRRIETEHFRLHFPAELEEWAKHAATRLEQSRPVLTSSVGFDPGGRIDVLVMDPSAEPNGFAFPVLGRPRMVLWTTPPDPESTIGNFSDWIDLLAVHEQGHLVHLLRPSRNRVQQILSTILPVGPLSLKAPRWVSEGYATVLEGQLTGSGRPNSALRNSMLRIWAQAGELPGYSAMNSDSQTFMGMSMAYLVGSSYLEWLEKREGPESLRRLWARMSARENRSFNEAFAGVFRGKPDELYNRYRAELTHAAIETEKARGGLREGELWQDLRWNTEPPQISPDGKLLVTVLRARKEPDRLVVLEIEEDSSEAERRLQRARDIHARDPSDFPSVDDRPPAREPQHELYSPDFRRLRSPRWLPDGSIVLVKSEPDADGLLRGELFLWKPGHRRLTRLTHGGAIADADPFPDGESVIAVRNLHGKSQLIRVFLGTGRIEEVTRPELGTIYDHPRVSRDGRDIAYVHHRGGRWNLVVRDLASGTERVVHNPQSGLLAQPAWSADGQWIFASLGVRDFVDIYQFRADGSGSEQLTRSRGGSFAPAPSPDGEDLFFLSLDPEGFDIRRVRLKADDRPAESSLLASAASSPEPTIQAPLNLQSESYGAGRQEWSLLIGGNTAPSSRTLEVGIRSGDVVGRLDSLLTGSLAWNRGFSGFAAEAMWRGWPVSVGAHLFQADEEARVDAGATPSRGGLELRAEWKRHLGRHVAEVALGGLYQQLGETTDTPSLDQELAFAELGIEGYSSLRKWQFPYEVSASAHIGNTEGDGWTRNRVHVGGGVNRSSTSFRIAWERGTSSDTLWAVDRFSVGGVPSTIVPQSALANRVYVPALEVATLSGERQETQSAEFRTGRVPVTLFYERHSAWSGDVGPRDWLSLAGLKFEYSAPPFPLLQLPAFDFTVGVAQILDEPMQGDTEWWFALAWRP